MRSNVNPYENPQHLAKVGSVTFHPGLAKTVLWTSAACVLCFHVVGWAQLPSPVLEDHPLIYNGLTALGIAFFILGSCACCLAIVVGGWKQRVAAVLIALFYLPHVEFVLSWVFDERWKSLWK